MRIGGSLTLLALGAILAFALRIDPTPVAGIAINWVTIGYILMIVGLFGLIWAVWATMSARDTHHTVEHRDDDAVGRGARRY